MDEDVQIKEKEIDDDFIWIPDVQGLRNALKGMGIGSKQIQVLHKLICVKKAPVDYLEGFYVGKQHIKMGLQSLSSLGLIKFSGTVWYPSDYLISKILNLNFDEYFDKKLRVVGGDFNG